MSKETSAGYELLDHPADMGFQVNAPSLKDIFKISAEALTSVLVEPGTVGTSLVHECEIEGEDAEYLLYNWLSELLFLFDAEGLLFSQFEITDLAINGHARLKARLAGEEYDSERHAIQTYVKAVTLHQLSIKPDSDSGFRAQVFVDI